MTNPTNEPPGWHLPLPEEMPKPSVYPVILALGVCFLAWGVLTSWIISAAGFLLSATGCAGWVAELRKENRKP